MLGGRERLTALPEGPNLVHGAEGAKDGSQASTEQSEARRPWLAEKYE